MQGLVPVPLPVLPAEPPAVQVPEPLALLAVQPEQGTIENNPGQVEVYVDSNTQLLNGQSLTAGNTFRFYGLVFNDNGTLRMDCAQVSDGVSLTPLPSAQTRRETASVRTVRAPGMLPQTMITGTPGGDSN